MAIVKVDCMKKIENFSLWCDFVERDFLKGEFRAMIARGEIVGATSNPAIFANAILNSGAYKSDIESLRGSGFNAKAIYESLAFNDIKSAAVSLLPLWEQNANDGFISIEIDPTLCDDVGRSIDEGVRIWNALNMPNVMIKVPATEAGFEVMSALYGRKISVNATLIFSQNQVQKCLEAFGRANRGFDSANLNESRAPKAVISIFVSRFDRYLEANPNANPTNLTNPALDSIESNNDSAPKLGIYNAMKCYEIIESFGSPHIRALFASTGVKGDKIPSAYYVENLLLKNSVNTAPLATIRDFIKLDSGLIQVFPKIDSYLAQFEVDKIAQNLLDAGLEAFKIEFEKMLKAI
mgnify:CR=1 FL=1